MQLHPPKHTREFTPQSRRRSRCCVRRARGSRLLSRFTYLSNDHQISAASHTLKITTCCRTGRCGRHAARSAAVALVTLSSGSLARVARRALPALVVYGRRHCNPRLCSKFHRQANDSTARRPTSDTTSRRRDAPSTSKASRRATSPPTRRTRPRTRANARRSHLRSGLPGVAGHAPQVQEIRTYYDFNDVDIDAIKSAANPPGIARRRASWTSPSCPPLHKVTGSTND